MSKERTIENIMAETPFYVDIYGWNFYEVGQNTELAPQTVGLTITNLPNDKIPIILVNIKTANGHMVLRLSPYEFDRLNALFKRASFRLEKV